MPILTSTYCPPNRFKSSFISTVYSGLARRVNDVKQQQERITLSDGDFLDLDWSFCKPNNNKLVIILHGLEGNAQRPYMLGAVKTFNQVGIDAVCINFRGCSGEDNLKYRSYHSGVSEDLEEVVKHIIKTKPYTEIYLNGFSLGGNVVLKYLGAHHAIPSQIKGAIAVSAPCNLYGSMLELLKFKNVLYANRFKRHLIGKLKLKQAQFPNKVSHADLNGIKNLKDFDDVYTSKAHGFKDALDYYKKSSSLQFLGAITIPTLIINAINDSFLSPACYPIREAKANANLFLEMPQYGGHVGFYAKNNVYYNETRALHFFESYC